MFCDRIIRPVHKKRGATGSQRGLSKSRVILLLINEIKNNIYSL